MRVTASKVGLLAECGYFARDEAKWVETTSEAAERGNAFHAAIAHFIATKKTPEGLSEDVENMVFRAMCWMRDWNAPFEAEVAFAWDPITDTAQRILVKDRDYSAHAGKLCGTADVIVVDRDRRWGYVGDWKTGDGSKAEPQLRALALMLARAEGLDEVDYESLEVSESGVRPVIKGILGSFDIAVIAGETAELLSRVEGSEPNPGPHCSELYCPAHATCPAGAAIVAELIPVESLVKHRWGLEVQSADHAAWLLSHARLVEAAAKGVRDAVSAAVPAEGWQLEDGSVLRESTRDMPRFDKAKALALLKQLGATGQQIAALTYTFKESAGLRVTKAKKPAKKTRPA